MEHSFTFFLTLKKHLQLRKLIPNILLWCLPVLLMAQAKEGTIEYKKKKQQTAKRINVPGRTEGLL
jgi:hypothetical protein